MIKQTIIAKAFIIKKIGLQVLMQDMVDASSLFFILGLYCILTGDGRSQLQDMADDLILFFIFDFNVHLHVTVGPNFSTWKMIGPNFKTWPMTRFCFSCRTLLIVYTCESRSQFQDMADTIFQFVSFHYLFSFHFHVKLPMNIEQQGKQGT